MQAVHSYLFEMAYRKQRLNVHTWNLIQILTSHDVMLQNTTAITLAFSTFELCPFDLRKKRFLRRI